jgi:predicted transcriptional regulator
MRRTEIRILDALHQEPATVTELADRLDKNQGWISELVSGLEAQNLVAKNTQVTLATTYESRLFADLLDTYDAERILAGKREPLLTALLDGPQSVGELETQGFAPSTVYDLLSDLKTAGVVTEAEDAYRISDETLVEFLTARRKASTATGEWTADDERLFVAKPDSRDDGEPTAFSAFRRYGVEYYPTDDYRYRGENDLGIEDVLMHAIRVAEDRKQMAMCGVFYLTHQSILDTNDLWRLANTWECVEKWADLLAFLDQRDVKQDDLFLPWEEFLSLANDYGVYPRGKHPTDSLLTGLEDLGDRLPRTIDAYLLGGGNLILRGLKDSTKDVDIVVEESDTFRILAEALQEQGYEERQDLEDAYQQLDPSIVLEKEGFPRWDIFVETVAGQLRLTPEMKERCDERREFGNLRIHFLSLTDIFLFKSITDREGDLEDAALIARQADIDWDEVMQELRTQEKLSVQYFSFAVLDTLDVLEERYGIDPPIHDELVSYCLENALLVTLAEPKTIEDLREELEFPDHRIYNKLRQLEDDGQIEADRSGKLNEYRSVSS